MDAMARAEMNAHKGQVEYLKKRWAKNVPGNTPIAQDVIQLAGMDPVADKEYVAALQEKARAGDPSVDAIYTDATRNVPQGLAGRAAGFLAQDNVAGGIARGTLFGGGVTAGGAAMTAGAQKLLGIMGILGENEETEVARDQPLQS